MRKIIYITLTEKIELDVAKIFSKVYSYGAKIYISIFVTGLAARYLIAIAYEERGYEAVGGEYMVLPVVFFVVYKFTGFVMKFLSVKVAKAWKKEK